MTGAPPIQGVLEKMAETIGGRVFVPGTAADNHPDGYRTVVRHRGGDNGESRVEDGGLLRLQQSVHRLPIRVALLCSSWSVVSSPSISAERSPAR